MSIDPYDDRSSVSRHRPEELSLLRAFQRVTRSNGGRCITSRRPDRDASKPTPSLVRRERAARDAVMACRERLKVQQRLVHHLKLMGASPTLAIEVLDSIGDLYRVYNELWEIYLAALDAGSGNRPWENNNACATSEDLDQDARSYARFAAYLNSTGSGSPESFHASRGALPACQRTAARNTAC